MTNATLKCILGTTALVLIVEHMPVIGIMIIGMTLLYCMAYPTPKKGTLRIKVINPRFRDFFEERAKSWNESKRQDSGFDVPTPEHLPCSGAVTRLRLGFAAAATTATGEPTEILLLSRSSNKDYPLTNGIGLLDSGYRGEVQASVRMPRYEGHYLHGNAPGDYEDDRMIKEGTRLFQLYAPGLGPGFNVVIVDDLDETERGTGGFGSTGVF